MTLLATQITEALVEAVQGATIAAGYPSDVGRLVFVGQLRGGAIQAPCTFVLPGASRDTAYYNGGREVTRQIEVRGFADANAYPDLTDHALVDQVIWDLRQVLAADPPLGGLADDLRYVSDRPGYREDGGTIVGAALTYELVFNVDIADPSTSI